MGSVIKLELVPLESIRYFCLYGGCVETESVDFDMIRFSIFSKARKGFDHLQKMPLNCTVLE